MSEVLRCQITFEFDSDAEGVKVAMAKFLQRLHWMAIPYERRLVEPNGRVTTQALTWSDTSRQ